MTYAFVVVSAWRLAAPLAMADGAKPNLIVIFTDDLGWPDLGCQGVMDDVRTPHLDDLAARGVRLTSGYITAPQCSPSRAGLLTGRYQQRFDFDDIGQCPLPLTETLFAERLQDAGYATGMVGKWHLEPNAISRNWAERKHPELLAANPNRLRVPRRLTTPYLPDRRGFEDVFQGELNRYWANYDLNGARFESAELIKREGYRLDLQTDAAVQFVRNHHDEPFYLHLAYFAPHVPLEATPRYLARFPGEMPERRRYALAMMSAVDDGVGRIVAELRRLGVEDDTMIVFTSDNGAPIKIHKEDITLDFKGGAWDGSVNDPLNGEKGTLLEGGIRVPFVMTWPSGLPAGKVVDTPVISLDIAATAMAMAGLDQPAELDGVDIAPHLRGEAPAPDRALFWRFWSQAAVRRGDWKLLTLGSGERYLFNLNEDLEERRNRIADFPSLAQKLEQQLSGWCDELIPAGIPNQPLLDQERRWAGAYLGWQEPTEP